MEYYITDGEGRYLSGAGGIHVVNKEKATKFKYDKAVNILKHGIPKSLGNLALWKYVKVEDESEEVDSISIYKDIMDMDFIPMDEIKGKLIKLSATTKELLDYSKCLDKKIAYIEKEIVDLYHYIEFSNFNAAKGYHAYKLLKDVLTQRRELKNERDVLRNFTQEDRISFYVADITERLDAVDNAQYQPRVLQELFNN